MMEIRPILGVIGGSGLYEIPGLKDVQPVEVETPFGRPSAPITVGWLANQPVAFLARHGLGHFIAPAEVNYRANLYALKSLGVTRVVGISACGSLREDFAPGDIVIPDQLFDFTRQRKSTFFEDGIVAHVNVAGPYCPALSYQLFQAVKATGVRVHRGGAYIAIQGPRFSTRAESNVYRAWGMDVIGMTNAPEAFLAREAELCYAVMAHVTDYDVWHVSEQPVTVEMVLHILEQNTAVAYQAVRYLVRDLKDERSCDCTNALANAIITRPEAMPAETRQKLALLISKYVK